ncbi:MAG: gamma carbonic anhydrase family protein [Megasphaera sp.]|nr:gamma carbonic anhydrase family protein [Megasphaera sp.]MCH4187871.1 gamma carbonic anhydrase family protein [Megasphaera sp.]MCH4218600.1 gamma carbonic anhydrase family protein [Megasphaera sp.]
MAKIVSFGGYTPQIDPSAYVAESAVITGNVIIEEGASIWPHAVIRGDAASIRIGKYTNVQDNATLHTDLDQPLTIGDYVVIGHNAVIHCTSVGTAALIGMGCVLLDDAEIGDESIIGAATLITQRKKIPARSMVYGTPFRIVRPVTDEEVLHTRQEAQSYYAASRKYKELQKP